MTDIFLETRRSIIPGVCSIIQKQQKTGLSPSHIGPTLPPIQLSVS
ncbi:MAG: exosporium leader peptide-containing protein [Eisenbergiella sp.]